MSFSGLARQQFDLFMASAGALVSSSASSFASTLGATGVLTATGGVTGSSAPSGVCNWQPVAATSGTDTTPASGTQFVTSIFLPVNMTITNISYLIGSQGGTDKVYAVLYDSAGAVLANTDISSSGTAVTVGTTANIQTIPLTAPYAATGLRRYFVGISMNGNTARLRTIPAHTQVGLLAGQVAQTHGTVAAITVPSTFTADKGPVIFFN